MTAGLGKENDMPDRLTPFQCLVLFALSAILSRLLGTCVANTTRHEALGQCLWESAKYGECQGNQNDRISERVENIK